MTLTLDPLLRLAGIDSADALVIMHTWVPVHQESGLVRLHADSTDEDVLTYTSQQSVSVHKFPSRPSRLWVVSSAKGVTARLWSVVENRGEVSRGETLRRFELVRSDHLADLRSRLVIGWPSPMNRRMSGSKAAAYPVKEIADAKSEPFPGFDWLELDYARLQAVMREHRYAAWRTALASLAGVYLITDTSDGRQYVGKAVGAERISQRWNAYATNKWGGNVELRNLDPRHLRFSLLRVFDPATSTRVIDLAESHFKKLSTRSAMA